MIVTAVSALVGIATPSALAGAPGACCLPGGGCQELSLPECDNAGGTWQGPGTLCVQVPCGPGGPEACCFQDGTCQDLPREECLSLGGSPQGPGTLCAKTMCFVFECGDPQSGSCFIANGTPGCADEACCLLICSIDPFCCDTSWDGICAGEALDLCEGAPPRGGCCLSPSQCVLVFEAACDAMGGNYLGDGTDCPQQILIVNHEGPPSEWSHTIETVGECPFPGGDSASGCVSGPFEIDPWSTNLDTGGMNCENFGAPSACPIPADFFGPGSDPFAGVICFMGDPLGVTTVAGFGPLDFGEADTLIRRDGDPFDRCDLPSATPVTVPIQMEQLHLVGTAPIDVTFNGGMSPEPWSVQVVVTDSSNQPPSSLTATKTHCNGGTFDSTIAVCPTFVFTKVDPPFTELSIDYCGGCNPAGIVMNATGLPWVHDPGVNISLVSPVCSDFHPGVNEVVQITACDCNNNQTRDTCDIESGTSLDCNADGIPDECQPAPCPADFDGTCSTGFSDLLNLLGVWGPCPNCPQDLNGNGSVDFADLLLLLGLWGDC